MIGDPADPRAREIEAYASRLAALERERDELKARAERAEHERNEFRKLYELVVLELERLKRQLFGQKAETVDPNQVQLAFEPVLKALEGYEDSLGVLRHALVCGDAAALSAWLAGGADWRRGLGE